ncbi:MAG: D-alanyl-lipoteichoic acid biosynthesis protein DltB [Anaerolineaceae bacterium]|nr:D-alanyl-lipoteichoic acid biosynthesis protein DltB [Anaerolineaceae bacterium]
MIPYANFLYFGVSLYVLIPNLVMGWIKKLARVWMVIATVIMLVVQYWVVQNISSQSAVFEIWLVVGYTLLEWAIAVGFLLVRRHGKKSWVFYTAALLSLLPLLAAKFVPLFQVNYGLFFLGLSYITFRSLDVIINIQDGLIQTLQPIQYFVFLLFFPTISSGPIDRYNRFSEDWKHERTRSEFLKDLDGGIHRIFTGFLYKFILAALIKTYWLDPVSGGTHLLQIVSYMYAYSFYLFFDFAGYSNFAVGFSYLFGIHTPENFNLPFLARNIRDFWNRWHISLSSWFRDHVYSRFVFSAIKGHWFQNKYVASYLGFILSMGLMGIWHGTAWNYIIYGFYHGCLLVVTDWFTRFNKQKKILNGERRIWQAASIFLTFNLVCFGFLIFSGRLG